MDVDVIRTILQAATGVLVGGGGLQLIQFLIRRKPERRKLEASASVDESTASSTLIQRLQEDGGIYREQVKRLEEKLTRLEDRAIQAQREFASELRTAHAENTRLTTRVAQLQTDNDILQRQIDELRRRI
ncbi:MAG: hypothetical protein ACRDRC_01710 [Pseudonocardiaceae bacterium]